MPATQTANPPTFESVWVALQEVAERQKETDRLIKEDRENIEKDRENIRLLRESQKESRDDFNVRMGNFTNFFGEIAEFMVAPKLREKFTEFGLKFPKANPNASVNDKDNQIFLEIDLMLENGDKAMLVEVKTNLTTERINKHIERLEKMRRYADLHGDKRTFLGAVAGVVLTDEARKYALDQGFYLIEPSGENVNITPPNGTPKEW